MFQLCNFLIYLNISQISALFLNSILVFILLHMIIIINFFLNEVQNIRIKYKIQNKFFLFKN